MNTPTQQTGGELPTPRTDEAQILASFNEVEPPHYPRAFLAVTADHARQLERETATLHAQLARLQQREGELVGALADLLFVYENADETGYVTDVGFVAGFDQLPDRCRTLLQSVAKEGEQ